MLQCSVRCLAGPGTTAGGAGQWAPPPSPPPQGPKINPFLPRADGPSHQGPEGTGFSGPSAGSAGPHSSQVRLDFILHLLLLGELVVLHHKRMTYVLGLSTQISPRLHSNTVKLLLHGNIFRPPNTVSSVA